MRWWLGLVLPLMMVAAAGAQDTDGDGVPDALERQLGSFVDRAEVFTTVATDPDEPGVGGPDQAVDIVAVRLANVGNDRWLWAIDCAGEADIADSVVHLYLDADNDERTGRQDKPEVVGTDIMYTFSNGIGSEGIHNPDLLKNRPGRARYAWDGQTLWICDDLAFPSGDAVARVRFRCLSQRPGSSDSFEFVAAEVPRVAVEQLPEIEQPSGLDFRGLPRAAVAPRGEVLEFGRPRPGLPLSATGRADKPAGVAQGEVAVEVTEEQGLARTAAPVTFGFPLPQGAIFQPTQLMVLLDGAELPADRAVASFWPDDSLRWVTIDTAIDLAPRQTRQVTVRYGGDVQQAAPPALRWTEADGRLTVDTGRATVVVEQDPLALASMTLAGDGAAPVALQGQFTLTDVAGHTYRLRRPEVKVELAGARRLVVRLEAPYTDEGGQAWFRGIVRLTFRADSAAVQVEHTLLDDVLDHEFSDFRNARFQLGLAGAPVGPILRARGDGPERGVEELAAGQTQGVWVPDHRRYVTTTDAVVAEHDGNTRGALAVAAATGGVAIAVQDFWERYPKGLSAGPGGVTFDLFPDQDGPARPSEDLPPRVTFPFVEGMYRFKWGMATTDRFTLVPFGSDAAAALAQALDSAEPVIAVVPAAWYAQTGALGELAVPAGDLFRAWDETFETGFARHMARKREVGEYGFFNWGDWYGERGTNWGNNEYDLPHGMFMQFARTGQRDYFRMALAGARHQADVDLIQAYPDPRYLGGNVPHSEAHTGEWSQNIKDRQWSFAYDTMHTAGNGHTWSSGMCDAWYLAGDARPMEGAIGLGEHIAWQFAPRFTALGTHERSAGWAAHAAAALYRATADTVYREALEKIVGVAYAEQKLDGNGAWPHPLPGDHAGPGHAGVVGNAYFLIGVLLNGIDDDYELTGSARAAQAITAAMPWIVSQWHPEVSAFQYTSSPYYGANVTARIAVLNDLGLGPILRAAELTGDEALLELATAGFIGTVAHGDDDFGKSLAQCAHFAPTIMARLQRLGAADKPYGAALHWGLERMRTEDLKKALPPTDLRLRGPLEKTVYFKHPGGAGEFVASRETWGARPKEEATGWVAIAGPAGEVLRETFDTDTFPVEVRAALPAGAPAGQYRVTIHDDLRGRWDVRGPGQRVVALDPPVAFGGPGQVRWVFFVPQGTARFGLRLDALHSGGFGLAVYGPDGELAALDSGPQDNKDRQAAAEVTVKAGQDDQFWSVVTWAGMDLQLTLQGVPPYLAASAEEWFLPQP